MPRVLYSIARVNFTCMILQLPELSGEEPDANTTTPTAKGYAIQWCEEKIFEKYSDKDIANYIKFLIATSKLLIIAFCYELYHKLLKHKIHQKTHRWYYIYWAVQTLIWAGMIIFIWFACIHQNNINSRQTFLLSLFFDILLGIVVLVVLLFQKYCKIFREKESEDAKKSEDNIFLVPPPLSLLCHW